MVQLFNFFSKSKPYEENYDPKIVEEVGAYFAQDSISNQKTGIGTWKDKSSYSNYENTQPFGFSNFVKLENLYASSGIARKIIDSVSEDMMREGVEIILKDKSESILQDKIREEEERINLHDKIQNALKLSRIYGGSIVLLIVRDDNLEEPLVLESVEKGDFRGIQVFDNFHCVALGEMDTDPLSDNFGRPLFYQMYSYNVNLNNFSPIVGARIHYSRVIRFTGSFLPQSMMMRNNYWGQSILEILYASILRYDTALKVSEIMLHEATVDVVKSPNVSQMYSAGGLKIFKNTYLRFQKALTDKSVIRTLLLGTDEEYQKITNNGFSGVRDILDHYEKNICAQSDIPAVRLFGESPKGLHSSGDGEIRNYYDMIQSKRIRELESKYKILYKIIIRNLTSKDTPFSLNFPPLWQPSDLEQAQMEKTRMDTDIGYLNANALSTQDIQDRLKKNETYVITQSSVVLAKAIDDKMLSGSEGVQDEQNIDAPADGEISATKEVNIASSSSPSRP